ncbi:MAG: flagella basal body P-ring formation protein FlgA [Acidobacteriota bacterium]|nr:flagella basal body P-ring formation protein FlgA [Acidobacteriota bacterium]
MTSVLPGLAWLLLAPLAGGTAPPGWCMQAQPGHTDWPARWQRTDCSAATADASTVRSTAVVQSGQQVLVQEAAGQEVMTLRGRALQAGRAGQSITVELQGHFLWDGSAERVVVRARVLDAQTVEVQW